MKRVSYIFPTSHHYRLPFHIRLRERLAMHDVDYRVVYADPGEENRRKGDTVDIPWGIKVDRTDLPGGIIYQHGLREALKSDLVIVQQENSLAMNYPLNLLSMMGAKRLAYFGHGRNFQARDRDSRSERWKRFWTTKVDWWFAYTDETRRHVESLGFPADKITVFNNAVDTTEVRKQIAEVTPEELAKWRHELGLVGERVGVFVGGLYPDKRLQFLVEAVDRVRSRIPNFSVVVVGGGVDLPLLRELAAERPWVKVLGPRFGAEKIQLMMLGEFFLMPGLVGLAILDAGAAGLPTITTAFPFHSPEIAYLEDGVNGLIVENWEDAQAYANALCKLLEAPDALLRMQTAVRHTAEELTIEHMSRRFAEGVLAALEL